MQLLVSVRDAGEATAALAGGADIVDAKEPSAGALGAVAVDVFAAIVDAVDGARPVTAAIGDAEHEATLEATARAFAQAGAAMVKVGFAGIDDPARATTLLRAARRGVERAGCGAVIAVAYADAAHAGALAPSAVVACARQAGVHGVLLDTTDKHGPALLDGMTHDALVAWVGEARAAGLLVALAGRLTLEALPRLQTLGPDLAGVRGAACEGGRTGRVSATRVRALRASLRRPSALAAHLGQR
jgi:uncharacterized protein (UPF0264 family)